MFDIRSSEEAEGERRMIGSGLLTGAFGLCARVVLFAGLAVAAAFLEMNGAANFLTYVKSCRSKLQSMA